MPSEPSQHPLAAFGWSPRVEALLSAVPRPAAPPEGVAGPVPARVVRVARDRCYLITADGEVEAIASELPAVGDWVVSGRTHPDGPMQVLGTAQRWSLLERHSPTKEATSQVLAANIDLVFVMTGLDRDVKGTRLDRELVMAWESGATPVVVLTKSDAVADSEAVAEFVRERTVGVDVILTSAKLDTGIDPVRERIGPTDTVVLMGASGVGKSTLANRLLGEDRLATGAVREADGKGRHTTTGRHLMPLPGGGVLIDTPGIRAVGMFDAAGGLDLAFADIEELALGCRFDDCVHGGEPGCAVVAAVEAGTLASARFESWQQLRDEIADVELRTDARARADLKRKDKVQAKAIRRYQRDQQ